MLGGVAGQAAATVPLWSLMGMAGLIEFVGAWLIALGILRNEEMGGGKTTRLTAAVAGDMTVRETRSLSLFVLHTSLPQATMTWQPPVDLYRTRDGWVVKLELAGVRLQDIVITVHGSQLRVEGVRRDWLLGADWRHQALEIAYNRFERTITLPCDLGLARITVEYREGMVLLRVTV